MYTIKKLLGTIVAGVGFFLGALLFFTSSSPVYADLQTNLDWCMTNSGAIDQGYPANFSYEKCAGLAQLYNDTNGDNWISSTGWFSDVNICDWHGIDCIYGPATFISLSDNNLSGSADLAALGYTYYLDINNNNLTAVNVSGATIVGLSISNNPITSLDLTYINTAIVDIYANNTNITSLDVSHLTGLGYLYLPYMDLNYFNTAPYTDYSNLYAFYIDNNNLCEDDLSADTIAFLDHFQVNWRSGQICIPPALANFSWTGSSSLPGASASYTFAYSAVNAIPGYPNNLFYFWFPTLSHEWRTGANLDDDVTITIDGTPSTGESSVQLGERFWVNINDPIPTGGTVVVTLNNVVNYGIAGSYDWTTPAQTTDGLSNETREAASMDPIVLAIPPITLEYALDRCDTNSGSINIPYQECVGLAYLYVETNGDDRNTHNGWFTDTNISNWENYSCYTPVDNITDILGVDQCNDGNWFAGGEFWRAVMLTGSGPVKNVYGINLSDNNLAGAIQSGLIYFPELRIVDIQDNYGDGDGLTAVNMSQNPLLEIADISDNDDDDTRTLDLSNNPLLWALNIDDLYLEDIDLSNNTGLIYVDIDGNDLSEFNTNGLNLLEYLDISRNSIGSFTSHAPSLIELDAYDNEMSNIDLSNSVLLERLDLEYNDLESIDLSLLTALDYLDLSNNSFAVIDPSYNTLLTDIDIGYNELETIDISNLSMLQYLRAQSNNLQSLDISNNLSLYNVYMDSNGMGSFTTAPMANYTQLSSINADYNGLCNITNTETLNILNTYAGSWIDYQFFCPVRNLEMTIDDNPVEISWDSPKANASSEDNSTNVIDYTISWTPDDGSGMIDLGDEWYNNTTHSWSYTIEGLENGTEYTFTVCAIHSNEGPSRTVCSSIRGTPGGSGTPRSHGGGGSQSRDYCPNGDYSPSHLDGKCGEKSVEPSTPEESDEETPVTGMCDDTEYRLAYLFSLKYNITSMPTCIDANMDGLLIRSHAAKMMSNYAINVLGKTPDNSKACDFSDMTDQSEEMQKYAETACKLGLMGLETDGVTPSAAFNPNEYLDKAQFATILSRLLYGEANNGNTTCWYCDHVAALQDAGVITVTTDLFDPLKRAFAMIMLMRTQKKNTYTNVDDSSRIDLDK